MLSTTEFQKIPPLPTSQPIMLSYCERAKDSLVQGHFIMTAKETEKVQIHAREISLDKEITK